MLVVQVNAVHAQPLQGFEHGLLHVLCAALDARVCAVGMAIGCMVAIGDRQTGIGVAELGCDGVVVARACYGLACTPGDAPLPDYGLLRQG